MDTFYPHGFVSYWNNAVAPPKNSNQLLPHNNNQLLPHNNKLIEAGPGILLHDFSGSHKIVNTLAPTPYVVDSSTDSVSEYNTLESAILTAKNCKPHPDKLAHTILLHRGKYTFGDHDSLKDDYPLNIHSNGDTTSPNAIISDDITSGGNKHFAGIIFTNGEYCMSGKEDSFFNCTIKDNFQFIVNEGTLKFTQCTFSTTFELPLIITKDYGRIILQNCTFKVRRKCTKEHKKRCSKGKSLIRLTSNECKTSLIDNCRLQVKIGGKLDYGEPNFFIVQMKDGSALEITDSTFHLDAAKDNKIIVIGDSSHRDCINLFITSCNFINKDSWGSNISLVSNLWTHRSKQLDCSIYVARCSFWGVRLVNFSNKFNKNRKNRDISTWDQHIVFVAIDGRLLTNTGIPTSIFEVRDVSNTKWVLSILNSAFLVNNKNTPFVVDNMKDMLLSLSDTSFINVPNNVVAPNLPPEGGGGNGSGAQQSWLNASKIDGRLDLNLGAGVSIFNLSAASLNDVANVVMNESNRLF